MDGRLAYEQSRKTYRTGGMRDEGMGRGDDVMRGYGVFKHNSSKGLHGFTA